MRNKTSILGALGSLFTVILMYHIVNLEFTTPYTHYRDSTEMTDYALLGSLLLPKGGLDINNNNSTNSMSDVHLTLDELKRLANLHEPSVKPTTTIIIQYESIQKLSQQLDSITEQKNINAPSMIHIVCSSPEDESIIQHYISGKRKLQVSITTEEEENWYQHINRINSDFVILINKGVIPGQGYFAFVLGLLHAPQFNRALIGTEPTAKKICQQDQAHHVHGIKDIIVLKREWYLHQERRYDLVPIALPVSVLNHELHGNIKTSCTNVPTGGLLFLKEDVENGSLDDMICQFGEKQQQGQVIHLVTVGEEVDAMPSCKNQDVIIIHHPVINGEEAARTINKLSPQVVIYEKAAAEKTSAMDNMMKEEATSFIGLPTQDIPLVTPWIAELSIDTLQQWHIPKINLIITTGGKRSQQLKNLLHSIKQGHYLGDQVDISIVIDEKSDAKSINMANELKWQQGIKNLRHRISGVHVMQIFTESWYPSNDDEYAIMLNDRLQLSPSFYVWSKYALLKYRYSGEQQTNNLFGISLYSPRIIDTDPSGRSLLPKQDNTAYLMQHPASQFGAGGALYFPQHWREFHDYITARLTDQAIIKRGSKLPHLFKDSLLTVSKSNKWLSSWRKYFDEMIYMRGYVMLYPSSVSYATFVSINSEPIKNKKKAELYVNAEKLYKVPLAMDLGDRGEVLLPDLEKMSVLDIHGKIVHDGVHELVTRGHVLQRKFSACEPVLNHQHDPSDMLCPFNQLVQVPIDHKEMPTKTISLLYSPTVIVEG